MNAREEILDAIRARRRGAAPLPESYHAPEVSGNLTAAFAEKAKGAFAEVKTLHNASEIPAAIADLLRARNLSAKVHLPANSALNDLAWDKNLTLERTPPSGEDTALATAPFAIAETGTLVYAAGEASPASWHFRPGLEIAVLKESAILAHFEDVLARMKQHGALACTVNLVTGPSRTGDIEQTMELGAHGPKALAILIVRD